jgi:site-specific DNA recombinase
MGLCFQKLPGHIGSQTDNIFARGGAMRAAVYIRWSTDDQAEGTTLSVQREACRHFILSQGWVYDEALLYVDDGYSGATLDRPALTALRRLARQGEVDCVVVYKLDRLSRSVLDTVKLVMEEWQGQVALKSAREAIDTATPMGRQVFYLLVSYAEWERNVIRERTASGKWRRAREGRNPGFGAAFGYRNTGQGRVAVDPAEAPVVKRVFDAALAGRSARQIAAALNQERVASRTGCGWSAATVAKLLRNPAYTGTLAYGRTAANPRAEGPKRVRQAPVVAVAGALPALVDAATFERVQAQLTARRPATMAPRAVAGGGLLSGVAVCGNCGAALTSHNRREGACRYYRCGAPAAKGAAACDGGFIPQEAVDEAVVAAVLQRYGGRVRPGQEAARQWKREEQRLAAAARRARAGLKQAAGRGARLQEACLAGRVTGAQLEQLLAIQQQEQERLQADLSRVEQELAAYRRAGAVAGAAAVGVAPGGTTAAGDAPGARTAAGDAPGATTAAGVDPGPWLRLTPAERKAVLRHLVRGARLHRTRGSDRIALEVTWTLCYTEYNHTVQT